MTDSAQQFRLDPRLDADCHTLGRLDCSLLLLMDNVLAPWFILVPEVGGVVEFHELDADVQQRLLGEINLLSRFVKDHFTVDKINVAAIGNMVRQLHVHVVGRSEGDWCWPGVVWGAEKGRGYTEAEVGDILRALENQLGSVFVLAREFEAGA